MTTTKVNSFSDKIAMFNTVKPAQKGSIDNKTKSKTVNPYTIKIENNSSDLDNKVTKEKELETKKELNNITPSKKTSDKLSTLIKPNIKNDPSSEKNATKLTANSKIINTDKLQVSDTNGKKTSSKSNQVASIYSKKQSNIISDDKEGKLTSIRKITNPVAKSTNFDKPSESKIINKVPLVKLTPKTAVSKSINFNNNEAKFENKDPKLVKKGTEQIKIKEDNIIKNDSMKKNSNNNVTQIKKLNTSIISSSKKVSILNIDNTENNQLCKEIDKNENNNLQAKINKIKVETKNYKLIENNSKPQTESIVKPSEIKEERKNSQNKSSMLKVENQKSKIIENTNKNESIVKPSEIKEERKNSQQKSSMLRVENQKSKIIEDTNKNDLIIKPSEVGEEKKKFQMGMAQMLMKGNPLFNKNKDKEESSNSKQMPFKNFEPPIIKKNSAQVNLKKKSINPEEDIMELVAFKPQVNKKKKMAKPDIFNSSSKPKPIVKKISTITNQASV